MYYANVVFIRNNSVDSNELFVGSDEAAVVKAAESRFTELCQSDSSFEDDTLSDALENGYYEMGSTAFGEPACVCLSWPQVTT